jgi:hypothetical protein
LSIVSSRKHRSALSLFISILFKSNKVIYKLNVDE